VGGRKWRRRASKGARARQRWDVFAGLVDGMVAAGGTGASPSQVNHTVTGDANLRITLGGMVPEGTTLGATTSGDLWGSPPRVERAMIGVPG
jgi:hypothetical protein